mgnify:CR=1 FL=1
MKIINNKISVLVLLAVFSATLFSCEKDLTSYNENPNEPEDVPAKYVLAHVQENTVYTVSYRIEQDFANFWVQHWAAPNYLDEDWYELRDATMNNSWNAFYAQTMMDCKHLIDRGGTDNQLSLAIGRKGQNARLAAKLTGWKIDIKSQTQIMEEDQQARDDIELDLDYDDEDEELESIEEKIETTDDIDLDFEDIGEIEPDLESEDIDS